MTRAVADELITSEIIVNGKNTTGYFDANGKLVSYDRPKRAIAGTNIRDVDVTTANSAYELPPYSPNKPVWDFDADGTTTYVRVYTEGATGQARSWMMDADEIPGLSPAQIRNKFDLPYTPTHVTDVAPPKGTTIRTGTVNEDNFGGDGGGIQYELQERIPSESFSNPRPLQ